MEDIEEKDLYEVYITRIFRVIPKNSVLITRNKFNGKSVSIVGGGFAFLSPFRESKLVSLAIRNFDYPKQNFEDSNGQDITVDLAVTVKIVDPIKYEYENTDVEAELKQLLESIMRSLIKKHTYEDLSKNRFELPAYNENSTPSMILHPVNIDEEMINARVILDEFAERNGLAIMNLYNKSIEQDPRIQEAYNKEVIARREAMALKVQKDAELERTKTDYEISKIKAEAEAYLVESKYKALINAVSGLPKQKQAEILKIFSLDPKSNANIFMTLDGDASVKNGLATGAAIGSALDENGKRKSK